MITAILTMLAAMLLGFTIRAGVKRMSDQDKHPLVSMENMMTGPSDL